MANEFLRLPAGLTEADYPVADNLLDFTPTTIGWNPPLAPTGSNIFANYIKAHPDLLRDYNRRLARPLGSPGSLPQNRFGAPISMAEYGYTHWGDTGQDEGRTLTQPVGMWGDPGRSPYLPYYYPGQFVDTTGEDLIEEEIEEAQQLNEEIAAAGGSQVITGGVTGGTTVQEEFEEEVEEEAAESQYPFGHTTFSGWYMDDRNPTGHWWALENAAWRDPDTGIRQGPKSWNGSMWV